MTEINFFVHKCCYSSWPKIFAPSTDYNIIYEKIKSLLIIIWNMSLEYSEKILNTHVFEDTFPFMDEIDVDSWPSKVANVSWRTCLRFVLYLEKWMTVKMQIQVINVKWKNPKRCSFDSSFFEYLKINWIRMGYSVTKIFIKDSCENYNLLTKTENWLWDIHKFDHLHVNLRLHRLYRQRRRWNLALRMKFLREIDFFRTKRRTKKS